LDFLGLAGLFLLFMVGLGSVLGFNSQLLLNSIVIDYS
jgi:hypothetical protein